MSGFHSLQLLEQLNYQRQKNEFCDVTVSVMGGLNYIAHRCVLAASSPKLHSLTSSVPTHGKLKSVIRLETLTACGFEPVLEYIYTGKLKLVEGNVDEVLATGRYLDLPDVIEMCVRMSGEATVTDHCTSQGTSGLETLWIEKSERLKTENHCFTDYNTADQEETAADDDADRLISTCGSPLKIVFERRLPKQNTNATVLGEAQQLVPSNSVVHCNIDSSRISAFRNRRKCQPEKVVSVMGRASNYYAKCCVTETGLYGMADHLISASSFDCDVCENDVQQVKEEPIEESSSADWHASYVAAEDASGDGTTYQLVREGTSRLRDLIVDSHGFKYSMSRTVGESVYWRCCVRNKNVTCGATLVERHGVYRRGYHDHVHQPPTHCGTTKTTKSSAEKGQRVFHPYSTNFSWGYKFKVRSATAGNVNTPWDIYIPTRKFGEKAVAVAKGRMKPDINEKMTYGELEYNQKGKSASPTDDETRCAYHGAADSPFVFDVNLKPDDRLGRRQSACVVVDDMWHGTVDELLSDELNGHNLNETSSGPNPTTHSTDIRNLRVRKPTFAKRCRKKYVEIQENICCDEGTRKEVVSQQTLSKSVASEGSAAKFQREAVTSDELFPSPTSAGELKLPSLVGSTVAQTVGPLKKQILSRKRIQTGPIACKICGKLCGRPSALTRHFRSHSTQTFPCVNCGLTFTNPVDYKRHAISAHDARRVFTCSFPGCKFGSDRLSTVERHAVIHSEEHVHSCNRCGKTFAQENGLLSHLRSCLETRSYLCDLCGAAFNHLQSMHSHRRIHTGEKPFECDECGSHFADYRNLKRHRRIHENTFPYECVVCDKKFRHSNSLKSHLSCHQIIQQNVKCL